MDHTQAPVLEAIRDFHRRGDVVFAPPGHKQGRGVDPRVRAVLGTDLFRADVLMMNGLDTRLQAGAGMALPDAASRDLSTVRVVRQ